MSDRRFSAAGSAAFEAWFASELALLSTAVTDALGDDLVALVLGGGYGRGEGGVVRDGGRERPYNDLDLFVIARTRDGVAARLAPIAARFEHRLGIAVDFSRPQRPADVARWEPRLMWHDLVSAHTVLAGPADALLRLAPLSVFRAPPPVEASRLLINRGAGLIWALRVARGVESAPDPEFVRRNAAKAMLSAGDAVLLAAGAFTPRAADRAARLAKYTYMLGETGPELLDAYGIATRFRTRPDAVEVPSTAAALERVAWLWTRVFLAIETRRLGAPFRDLADYLACAAPREPAATWREALANAWRNLRRGETTSASPHEPLYLEVPRLLAPAGAPSWSARTGALVGRWRAEPA